MPVEKKLQISGMDWRFEKSMCYSGSFDILYSKNFMLFKFQQSKLSFDILYFNIWNFLIPTSRWLSNREIQRVHSNLILFGAVLPGSYISIKNHIFIYFQWMGGYPPPRFIYFFEMKLKKLIYFGGFWMNGWMSSTVHIFL